MPQGRVLIVEDDAELAKVLRLYFTAQDYEVSVAHRGRKALDCCRSQLLPDTVILDIKLPDMDGYEVLRALRGNAHTNHIPVIILTQKDERTAGSDVFVPDRDRYLTKPFEFAELKLCLRETIDYLRREPSIPNTVGAETSGAEERDYANQLAEQLSLWAADPELAKVLIEVNRLTSSSIHDMTKIGALLDLVAEATVSAETYADLRHHLWRCRLAYENLNWLRYKVRRFQPFQPASLGKALAEMRNWLEQPATGDFTFATGAEYLVAMPQLRLQQALYALHQWILHDSPAHVEISTQTTGEEVVVIFSSVTSPVDASGLLTALNKSEPGAVYGYLVRKIAARYGGRIETQEREIALILPAPRSTLIEDRAALKQMIAEQESHLEKLEQSSTIASPREFSPATLPTVLELIDPLARDLLAKLEGTREFLHTNAEIDCDAVPWLAIDRNLRFFQLLATLHKDSQFQPTSVQLDHLLESIKSILAHRLIDHEFVVLSEVATPVIISDETCLQQIFTHLALNALEAMPEDGRLTFHIDRNDEGYIVEVSDDGCGIPAEHLPQPIFDLYFTTKGAGRGIGLYRVKRYVERVGGQIEVNSEVGRGTTVSVKLPLG